MDNETVRIKNLVNGQLSIILPELKYSRTFERKNVIKPMSVEILKEAIWDPGFSYMLKQGMIEILDKDVCKEFGIAITDNIDDFITEKKNSDNEEVVLLLDDNQKKRYLTVAPVSELKTILRQLTLDQKKELAEFAITNKYLDFERADIIKAATGIDIIAAAKLRHDLEV